MHFIHQARFFWSDDAGRFIEKGIVGEILFVIGQNTSDRFSRSVHLLGNFDNDAVAAGIASACVLFCQIDYFGFLTGSKFCEGFRFFGA